MTCTLWIPGKFDLTNKMLDNLRAAGVYTGLCRAKRKKFKAGFDLYAAEVERIKWQVVFKARVTDLARHRTGLPVALTFVIFGHRRHDPDAWLLLAKAATDGLLVARVLASDRYEVDRTTGTVCRTAAQERIFAQSLGLPPEPGPGFAIRLDEVAEVAP